MYLYLCLCLCLCLYQSSVQGSPEKLRVRWRFIKAPFALRRIRSTADLRRRRSVSDKVPEVKGSLSLLCTRKRNSAVDYLVLEIGKLIVSFSRR
ncbi:hypothetical protein J3F84DRAFT_384931 [Trichoderma pleuroticola]